LQTYPPASLLGVDPKPVPSPDIVTSAAANARYSIALETWGETLRSKLAGVCVWAKERGMPDAPC
jgi:hypothetical protein